jgi:hypothetical protein
VMAMSSDNSHLLRALSEYLKNSLPPFESACVVRLLLRDDEFFLLAYPRLGAWYLNPHRQAVPRPQTEPWVTSDNGEPWLGDQADISTVRYNER